jgi:hypothetical protein
VRPRRDISGIEPFDDQPARKTIIQYANRDTLTLAKATADMSRAVKATGQTPDAFRFVSRGAVSDTGRTRIAQAASALGRSEASPLEIILCTRKKSEQIDLLELDKSGIHVAEYLTTLPPRAVLVERLHQTTQRAQLQIKQRGDREDKR